MEKDESEGEEPIIIGNEEEENEEDEAGDMIADLKETPKIIIPIENDILIYSPIYKNIILDFVANIREEINKQYDYFKTYSDISDAFKDPIFLSYINVLDEI